MSITKLALEDLKRSGLTATDKKKLRLRNMNAAATKKITGGLMEQEAYLIPYPDINGKFPTNKDKAYYWRVRYLGEVKGKFGATLKKPPRYSGPKNTLPRFYLPTTLKLGWNKIAKDVKQPIVFTEGEKKAAAACKVGINCVSVPGVWAWRSAKMGVAEIPDFDLFDWEDRKVYMCFDNDLYDNPLVKSALSKLAQVLTKRGAHVVIKYLPKTKAKIALDDYLLKNSFEKWFKLKEEEFAESKELWELNSEVVLVKEIGMIYDYDVQALMSRDQFTNTNYADRTYMESVVRSDGSEGFKEKETAKVWMKWPNRSTVKGLCYRPGQEPITWDNKLNQWPGFATAPIKGNIKPFMTLLKYLIPDDKARHWFLQWLAYPIQFPGTKLNQCCIIQSIYQGNGKSFIGFIMGDIYGDNFSVVGEEELHSDYNDWRVNKQFIMGEEITGSDKKRDMDKLKAMISSESIRSNAKYEKNYKIEDCANFFLSTNHFNSLILETNDRRFWVWSVDRPKLDPDFYQVELDTWRRRGGAAHLHYHLLNEIDLDGFRPRGDAPETIYKADMIDLSKSDIDLFCERLRSDPDDVLSMGNAINSNMLVTPTELAKFFPNYNISARGLGAALKRNHFPSKRITVNGQTINLYAVRETDKMRTAHASRWSEVYKQQLKRALKFK